MTDKDKQAKLRRAALEYHKSPIPGKFTITPSKDMANQRDLSLAYSPGVAAPCEEIAKDPTKAWDYTTRGNMVAVISNGTAVLGLGNIGALASKPVMEGKSVLFKKFANIDSVDIEIDEEDVDTLVETIARLEPSFGGINLEDFKAPECFELERRLKERMNIPVFHDDQHGTAIIVCAAVLNWIKLTGRKIEDVKLVSSGAGASAISCMNLLVRLGMRKENITATDRKGVIYKGRNPNMEQERVQFAQETEARELQEVIKGADIFLGLSAAGVLKSEWLDDFNKDPLILALANPTPEIMPEQVYEKRPDAYVATGRSDYPNQVNNVICFPFIFRGALDAGAKKITEEIKLACVKAIANLAQKEPDESVLAVYAGENLEFGKEYLIPKPFDPRLMIEIPIAVAKESMALDIADRPIKDFDAYKQKLESFTNQTSMVMRPVFAMARKEKRKIIYAEGEEKHVIQAAQVVSDEGIGYPILIGRKEVVTTRLKRLGLRLKLGEDFDLVDPEDDPRYRDYWTSYHKLMERKGVTEAGARTVTRTNATVIGSLLLSKGEGDALICGAVGSYNFHLRHVMDIIPLKEDVSTPSAMNLLLLNKGNFFICDTYVNPNPTAEEIAQMTIQASEEIHRFGIKPKVALLSHSSFGSHKDEGAMKMREVLGLLNRLAPDLEVEGEMHPDAAIDPFLRKNVFPHAALEGTANLLVMPSLEAANIAFNLLKVLGEGISVGPILLGLSKPVHILTPSVGARGVINLSAVAMAEVQAAHEGMKGQESLSF